MTNDETFELLQDILGNAETEPDKNGDSTFQCPNCDHPKPHLVVNIDKELYHCWICEFSGIGHKYCLSKLGFFKEAKQYFSNHRKTLAEFNRSTIYQLMHPEYANSPQNEWKLAIPNDYMQLYFKKKKSSYHNANDYLATRGLNSDDIIKYNIHYNPEQRRILIPSYDANFKLNYYITRAIDDSFVKYTNPDIPKTEFIFNEHLINWNEKLHIFEGVFDSILSRKNSVALLGSSLKANNKLFQKILQHQTKVIIALDPDAFQKQSRVAKLFFKNDIQVDIVDSRENDNDIADIGEEGYNKLLSKKLINFGLREIIASRLNE